MPTKAHLLYRAAKAGDEAEAIRLLDQGADPKKYKNEYGEKRTATTLCHAAERFKSGEVVQRLIQRNASVITRDKYGDSPLHWAMSEKNIQLLVEAGADFTARNVYGESPLALAALRGFPESVAMLLGKGADPAETDTSGKTPLHRAKTPEVVRILVDAGASLGVIDKDGNTPLHAVAARGKMDAYDALVAAGADERVLNQDEKTARMLADEREARLAQQQDGSSLAGAQ
eukprot:m.195262 g.195262  ORF g.195262 m.195262 type:complete len:230 (+) comp15226_c0_seq2:193-882(+)